ncbi:DEAD-box ATP-dependent RNA helicase [Acrasis kona]|uniref:DEAD-box ATP-dependent RNA helicase n=1 Tax=Acrasis kona TaxID=1008807 RepID=A0AAW2ZQY4_9EUKA
MFNFNMLNFHPILRALAHNTRAIKSHRITCTILTNRRYAISKNKASLQLETIDKPKGKAEVTKDFFENNIGEDLTTYLKEKIGIKQPSPVQRLAIPDVLNGEDVMIAAQTGTGKTLAYLLPLLLRMKKDEKNGVERRPSRPKLLIVVPSRELVDQIGSVLRILSFSLKFRTVLLRSDYKPSRMASDLKQPVDVLVATPGVLAKMHGDTKKNTKQGFHYSDMRYCVLDEADVLLSGNFKDEVMDTVIRRINNVAEHKHKVQTVMVMSTFNSEIKSFIKDKFPKMKIDSTPTVHTHLSSIEQNFIHSPADKITPLLKILNDDLTKQFNNQKYQIIVFCNSVASCRAAHHAAIEAGIDACCYHSEIPQEIQSKEFTRFKSGLCRVMICTDLASRGLDLPDVRHVVMFDMTLNVVDFLHRSGRTGRLNPTTGQAVKGKVTCILNRKREVALAKLIMADTSSGRGVEKSSSILTYKARLMGKQSSNNRNEAGGGKRREFWIKNKHKLISRQKRAGIDSNNKVAKSSMKDGAPRSRLGVRRTEKINKLPYKEKVKKGYNPTRNIKDTISVPNK